MVSGAPLTPESHTPVVIITRAVMVQMTIVSMNGPSIATMPSRTGSSTLAVECAIGAEPWPDSFENSPRLSPHEMVSQTVDAAQSRRQRRSG